jgi:hypothetical protein
MSLLTSTDHSSTPSPFSAGATPRYFPRRALRGLIALLACLSVAAKCDSEEPTTCGGDTDCQDGTYCNGYELCDPSHPRSDARGCLAGVRCDAIPVPVHSTDPQPGPTQQTCREEAARQQIIAQCLRRQDGRYVVVLGGLSEDECTPVRSDFANVCLVEQCTSEADCQDGNWCNGREICNPAWGLGLDGRGCHWGTHECGADECHERQRMCGDLRCENPDADGDGYDSIECGGDDCDDTDPRIHPGAVEICDPDHVDEDCDPSTLGDRDLDGDGYIDERCGNYQPNGTLLLGNDCDDTNPDVHPHQAEVCNGIDDNCNGLVDEGLLVDSWVDADHDGFGAASSVASSQCPGTPGYAYNAWDCDDANALVVPGAIVCDDETEDPFDYFVCKMGEWGEDSCVEQMSCRTQPGGIGICTY